MDFEISQSDLQNEIQTRSIDTTKPNVFMISHLFPKPGDDEKGIFIKKQIEYYARYANIFLCVPVHSLPSIYRLKKAGGAAGKWRTLKTEIYEKFLRPLPSFDRPVRGEYIHYLSLPPPKLFPFSGGFFLYLRLSAFLKGNHSFNLVHGQTALPDGLAAVLLGKRYNIPSMVTVRGSDVHSIKENTLKYFTTRFVMRNAAVITSVSLDLKQRVIDMGIEADKVIVINNGVDPKMVDASNKKDIRCQFGIPLSAKLITFIGRLIEVKNPMLLLKAFKIVHEKEKNAYLLFVGAGDLADELNRFTETNRLSDRVRFTNGMVPHGNIGRYMSDSDMICVSSNREGWPNVLLEAMIFGKPVVATKVGGIPECITDADYGILVPPGNEDLLAAAIVQGLNKDWDHQKIMNHAKKNSWENVAKKYSYLYNRLTFKSKKNVV